MKIDLQSIPHLIASCLFFILVLRTLVTIKLKLNIGANSWLVLLFLVLAVLLFDEFLIINSVLMGNSALWDRIITSLNLTIGPITFYYANAMISRNQKPLRGQFLHLLPALVFFSMSWFFDDSNLMNNTSIKVTFSLLFLATLLPYIFKVANDLKHYKQGVKQQYSSLVSHDLSWLKLWIAFMVLMALIICITPVLTYLPLLKSLTLDVHYLLIIASVVFLLMPDIGEQKSITEAHLKNNMLRTPDQEVIKAFEHIEMIVTEHKCYLNNDLSLAELSRQCHLPESLVSSAINTIGQRCFYDYINEHRVEEAKRLLVKYKSRSVIDVAMESGFNAKSTFYSAFKKFVGISPSEFRKNEN